jgi:hypothetical protein
MSKLLERDMIATAISFSPPPEETAEILEKKPGNAPGLPWDRYAFRYIRAVTNCQMPPARPVESHVSCSETMIRMSVA